MTNIWLTLRSSREQRIWGKFLDDSLIASTAAMATAILIEGKGQLYALALAALGFCMLLIMINILKT
jgi:hypothetical protein